MITVLIAHFTLVSTPQPLKVTTVPEFVIEEVDKLLTYAADRSEAQLRGIFEKCRDASYDTVQKLLEELRKKKEQGRCSLLPCLLEVL